MVLICRGQKLSVSAYAEYRPCRAFVLFGGVPTCNLHVFRSTDGLYFYPRKGAKLHSSSYSPQFLLNRVNVESVPAAFQSAIPLSTPLVCSASSSPLLRARLPSDMTSWAGGCLSDTSSISCWWSQTDCVTFISKRFHMNFANVSPSGCATFELYLVVLHLLNQFFRIHARCGVSPEPGADGSHDVFQRLEYGPLPVLLLFQDHLQALSRTYDSSVFALTSWADRWLRPQTVPTAPTVVAELLVSRQPAALGGCRSPNQSMEQQKPMWDQAVLKQWNKPTHDQTKPIHTNSETYKLPLEVRELACPLARWSCRSSRPSGLRSRSVRFAAPSFRLAESRDPWLLGMHRPWRL